MYGKLFASLYQGTLRGRANEILVFTNLIAHADREGFVDKHWRAISEEVGLAVSDVKSACLALEQPDPESRTNVADGARLQRIDDHREWGWKIVNYAKYRDIKNQEDRRIQNRNAQDRFRAKKMAGVSVSNHPSATVSNSKQSSAASAHADADADADANNTPPPSPSAPLVGFEEFWNLYPRKQAKQSAINAWKRVALHDHPKIMANVSTRMRQDPQWTKDGGAFIPHPASYLNRQRWNDEMLPTSGAPKVPPNETDDQRKARIKQELHQMTIDAMQ